MRYVAIGDSFTEGVGDERPDGSPRGWADLVASGLAAAAGGPVSYANLAVRGRLLEAIVGEQLDAALSLSPAPTLISLNGGGNDMLRPSADMARLARMTGQAVRRCDEAGIPLLLLAGADPSARLPLGRVMHRRGEQLTAAVAELATRHGLVFADAWHDREVRRPGYWSPDRLHLNSAGHARVAGLVLSALGHDAPASVVPAGPVQRRRLLEEARYYREHVGPWVGRRVRGQSSGDRRTPKHSDWVVVEP
ncbi:SGNH/GDSL hydrolase family protein [Motilibacter aurantiacus]|uniref:SGNH/GDSL hydrolase family protein n=1 Tax=Motilibacter aurantiacus TaxID=2714955 RepID=UPI00140A0027|nr:SGNH/GDSL hydrolase family protein [Motilibacter aurantiacus]NHC44425.1 SGNH/GDSL hydrolase family protein [Motilibacter aurantiacus]